MKLPKIGTPAANALENIGITTLEQVTEFDRVNLAKIHGIGPKAIQILEASFEKKNLNWKKENLSIIQTPFAVIGDLRCDNAPKRRIIRDTFLAALMGETTFLETKLDQDFKWISRGASVQLNAADFISHFSVYEKRASLVSIESIITHGKEGAIHGVISDEEGMKNYFALFITFKSTRKDAAISQCVGFEVFES